MNKRRKKESSLHYIAKGMAVFGRDLALDTAGELLDLGMGALVGLGTLGSFTPPVGEANPRRRGTRPQMQRRRTR